MDEYIEREALTCADCIHYDICIFHHKGNENEKCMHFKNKADVVEVRHGEWEVHLNSDGALNHYECPVCHKAQGHISNYCEDCGTKMDGKGDTDG